MRLAKLIFWRYVFLGTVVIFTLLVLNYCQATDKSNEKKLHQLPVSSQELTKMPEISKISTGIFKDIEFPKEFFFGTASSDFQTTGGNGLSDWNVYINDCVQSQRKCRREDDLRPFVGPDTGTDFLNRYKEDMDLAEKIAPLVHRISLEWSRIEPEEGSWDEKALAKYAEIFTYMRSKGIEPMICLNHFALPLWFSEMGGWENPQAAFYYSRYAEKVAEKLGKPLKIKWWLTFNEPQVMVLPYMNGGWPPNKPIRDYQDSDGTKRLLLVASNLIDSHRLSYRAIHKLLGNEVKVSFASAPGSFYPYDPNSPLDQIAYNIHNVANTLLFDFAVGRTDRDFIGLNYYGRNKLIFHISWWRNILPWLSEERPFAIEWEVPLERKQGDRPYEFYPRGLYDMVMQFKDLGLPIVITENGINNPDDKFREEYMVIHLKAVHDAMRDGADIIGYQYWSLTDTWEWDGNFSGFGLINIDRENGLVRNLRPSALTYGEIIRTRKISKELLEKHKELLEIEQ